MAVDNKTIVDKKEGRFEVLSSSTYPSADVSQTVDGVLKIEIDTGSGYSTSYDNTDYNLPNYTIPINGVGTVGAISNDIYVALIEDALGVMIKGTYRFTFSDQYLIAAAPTVITQTITFNYTEDVEVKPCLTHLVNCSIPKITVEDSQDYIFNTITPTYETSTLVLNYPETSGQPNLTVSSVPFTLETNNVWTKGYNAASTVIALYDFTSYLERIESLAEISFEVNCASLCSIYDCIASLKAALDAAYVTNPKKYTELLADYELAMSISTQVLIAQGCGESDDIDALVNNIKDIINKSNCDADCGCSDCDGSTVSTKVKGSTGDPLALENAYLGVGGSDPVDSADVLALTETIILNNQVTLNTGSVETKFKVCLPPTKTIQQVIDTDASDQDVTSAYVLQGTIPVVIDAVAYNYNIYVADNTIPYSTSHAHVVIING